MSYKKAPKPPAKKSGSLVPGRVYGSSLPPSSYTDVTDPLMSSANEAHWSMGGPGFSRLTLQSEIGSNVNKLRAERESRSPVVDACSCFGGSESNKAVSFSPPPVPFATKRRRYMSFMDDVEEDGAEAEEIGDGIRRARRRLVKKLGEDFDRVATENERIDLPETGNEGKNGKLGGSSDDGATVMKVAEGVNNSNYEGKKAKTGKNSKIQGNKNSVSGNGVRTSSTLAKI